MANIRVGCAVVAEDNGRLILGRRGKEPFYGKWVIPGGGVHLFEDFRETARREFREETGLIISVTRVAHVAQIIAPPSEHRIVIYVKAKITGGQECSGSDLLEIGHFDRNEINELAAAGQLTPTVKQVLKKLKWLSAEHNIRYRKIDQAQLRLLGFLAQPIVYSLSRFLQYCLPRVPPTYCTAWRSVRAV